jgi:hypothetical protein
MNGRVANDKEKETSTQSILSDSAIDLIQKMNQIDNEFNMLNVSNLKDNKNINNENGNGASIILTKCAEFNKELYAFYNTKGDGAEPPQLKELSKIKLGKNYDKNTINLLIFYSALLTYSLTIIKQYPSLNGDNSEVIQGVKQILSLFLVLVENYKSLNKIITEFTKSSSESKKFINEFLHKTYLPETIFYFIVLTKQNIEEFVPMIIDFPQKNEILIPYSDKIIITDEQKIKTYIKPHNSSNSSNLSNSKKVNPKKSNSNSVKYNIKTKVYLCPPTLIELTLPPNHKPSTTSVTTKIKGIHYRVNIPKGTKPGSIIRITQPKDGILNTGQEPPYCNIKYNETIYKEIIKQYYKIVDLNIIDKVTGLKHSEFKLSRGKFQRNNTNKYTNKNSNTNGNSQNSGNTGSNGQNTRGNGQNTRGNGQNTRGNGQNTRGNGQLQNPKLTKLMRYTRGLKSGIKSAGKATKYMMPTTNGMRGVGSTLSAIGTGLVSGLVS